MAHQSKTTFFLAAILMAGVSGAALAQDGADPGDATPRPGIAGGHSQAAFIASHDLNGDGKVSLEEVIAARSARFLAADRDGDGQLSETEYVTEYASRAVRQYYEQGRDVTDERFQGNLKQAGVRFALLDRDRDGFLSLEEDLESARKTFARNDTNGDGFVSAEDPAPVRESDNNSGDAEQPAQGEAEQKDG